MHNAVEPAAIHVGTEGDIRLGNLRYAVPVHINRYNQTQARTLVAPGATDSPPRVASFRTPSGSSAVQFSGPWVCMSPERLLGLECSYASDVWSLGVCLLHLALGRCPYLETETRSVNALKNAVVGGALRERLMHMDRELSDEHLLTFIDMCLHPIPQKRPTLASLLSDFTFTQKGQSMAQERMRSWLVGDTSFFAEDAAVAAQEEFQRYTLLAQRTVTSGAILQLFSNAHIENRMPHVPVAAPLKLQPSGEILIADSSASDSSPSAPKFVAWAKPGPSCNLEPLMFGASASVWALMVSADKQRGCFHLCLQSGERVDVVAPSAEQAALWVRGVTMVLEAAERQKSSIKFEKQMPVARAKKVEDVKDDRPLTPPQPSLPPIPQARGDGAAHKTDSNGLLDVAHMRWHRIQVWQRCVCHDFDNNAHDSLSVRHQCCKYLPPSKASARCAP